MSVKSPSAPTCPGTHDPTSPQSFLMTFTKFSKSPKRPKISDNILGRTCCSFHHLFFFFLGHGGCCFFTFYFLKPPTLPLFCRALMPWITCAKTICHESVHSQCLWPKQTVFSSLCQSCLLLHLRHPATFPLRSSWCPNEEMMSHLFIWCHWFCSVALKEMLFTHQYCFFTV